jgi:ribulose-phosphate 3-epimerase
MSKEASRSDRRGPGQAPPLPAKLNQVTFAPSILAGDFANLERELRKIERAGCRWAHLDIMDGHFVPNLTVGPPVVRCLTQAVPELFYDTHLMVENPLKLAREFIQAGASNVTFHLEAAEDAPALCRYLRRQRVRVGISIRPRTPTRLLQPVLKLIDLVLIMTVEPGFGGQELLPRTLNKVRELKHMREMEKLGFLIQVDGGINESNVRLVAAAGAEVLVAGTAIFHKGEVAENLRRLRQALLHPSASNNNNNSDAASA